MTTTPPVCSRCVFSWAEVLLICIGGRPSEKVTVVCTCRARKTGHAHWVQSLVSVAAATVTLASQQVAARTCLQDHQQVIRMSSSVAEFLY